MRAWRGFVAVVACAMAGVLLLAPPALSAGTWTLTGSMNTIRANHTATLLPTTGKVLVAAGTTVAGPLASAELYDPATGAWSVTGSLDTARQRPTATLLPSGKVLVAGGLDSGQHPLASAELYDPLSGAWSATGSMNTARIGHTATLLPDGKVLVAGGQGSGVPALASAELYDPATGMWTPTGSLNAARTFYTATLLPTGKVLVAGGQGPGSTLPSGTLASAELYDPATGTWSATGSMNAAHTFHTASLLETGKVLVAGGAGAVCCVSGVATTELYDPASGTWSATGSLNTGRLFHTATLLKRGKVLVAGGVGPDGATLASAETYHPTTGVWKPVGPLNTVRSLDTATLLPSGEVLVAGGIGSSINALASAELFTPPTALELAPSLVADSTGVGPGKALANKAAAIQAAVNADQTAHACTRIKDYLALVQAHTGKKLTSDQAIGLTTQATDLADELDC